MRLKFRKRRAEKAGKPPKFCFSRLNKIVLISWGIFTVLLNAVLFAVSNLAELNGFNAAVYFILGIASVICTPSYLIYLIGSLIIAYNKR